MHMLKTLVWLMLAFDVSYVTMNTEEDDWIDPYDMLPGKTKHKNQAMRDETTEQQPPKVNTDKTTFSGGYISEKSDDKTEDLEPSKAKIPKEPLQSSLIEPTEKEDKDTAPPRSKQKLSANSSIYKTLYRKHVKMIVDRWDGQAVSGETALNFVLALSSGDLKLLRRFFESGEGNIHEIEDVLQRMVVHVEPPVGLNFNSGFLESYIGISLTTVIQILAVLALISVIMWIELTLQISWRQKLIKLIVLSFFISIPWTWYHMYKQEEAKRQSELMKDIPEVCLKRKLSWYEMAAEVTRSMFTLSEDQCVKYYEQMLVDPVWKVAPTEAIAVTFVRFFLSPAKYVGQALSEFVKGTFQHLPVTLWPIMIVCGMILIILILLFSFGYSIRFPFLLSIESSSSSVSKHRLEIMSSENNQQKKQIEELKEKLKEVEGDRLRLTYTLHSTHSDSSLRSIAMSQNSIATPQNHQMRISSSDHVDQSRGDLLPSRVQSIRPNLLVDEQESIMYVKQDNAVTNGTEQEEKIEANINKQQHSCRLSGNIVCENPSGDVDTIRYGNVDKNRSGNVDKNRSGNEDIECFSGSSLDKISEEHIHNLSSNIMLETNGVPPVSQDLNVETVTFENGQSGQEVNGVNNVIENVQ